MGEKIRLPEVKYDTGYDVNRALHERRSVREYKNEALALKELAHLLWAAQGVTSLGGFRTAPSAGALYPLETYAVVGDVVTLEPGIYRYDPQSQTLTQTAEGDKRRELAAACLGQTWMAPAPVMIAFSAVYERTTERYGERGTRYVHMEVGHAGQNVAIEAVALGLGSVIVAAFDDEKVKEVLDLPEEEHPLYLIPVGHK